MICLAGLAFYTWGFWQQTGVARLPPDLEISRLSYPVLANGKVAADSEELRFFAEGWPVGTQLELTLADGTQRPVVLVPRRDHAYLWITAASAFVFWIMSLFAFAPRVHRPGGAYFFWITFLYGLGIATGGIYFRGTQPWSWSIPGYLQVAALATLPVVFVQMALAFPRRSGVRDKAPWLPPLLWIVAFVLTIGEAASFETYFRSTTPDRAARLHAVQLIADLVMVVQVILGIALLIWQGRTTPSARERSQVRWLLRGFFVGAAPYVFLRTLPTAFGLPALLPPHADRVMELAIPATLLFVVIQHQLLDIDVNARRGLLYGILANIVLAGYVLVALAVKPIPIGVAPWASDLLWLVLGIGGGLVLGPFRRGLAAWTDRHIFQVLHNDEDLLSELDRALERADTGADVLSALRPQLIAAFRPRRLAVLTYEGKEIRIEGRMSEEDAREVLRAWWDSGSSSMHVGAVPGSTDDAAAESPDFPAMIRERGFVLGASLRSGDAVAGLMLLGPRATRRHYVRRQLLLFGAMAERVGVRLVRMELLRRVLAEEADRRRLDELHQAKTDFLTRVAHDLRTPLTSISWSVQNLLDGVVGPVSEKQGDYLRLIEHTCGYQHRIVENLLRASRLERGDLEAHCEGIDAGDIVRRSVSVLTPVARAKDVALDLEIPAMAMVAWGDAHLLEEALVNIVENAIRFSPPGSRIDLAVENGDERVSIRIRDRGPGLPPGRREDLFERFAQGPPSPWQSQGFGLGLHIAYAHLTLMGGDLSANDHAEGGAVFTCSLRPRERDGR